MLTLAALLGGSGVLIGAFGSHGLKSIATPQGLEWWETGSRYQIYHSLALLLCGLLGRTGSAPRLSAWAFVVGISLFSGSLYAMALTDQRWFAFATPLGGASLALGWLSLLPHCGSRPDGTRPCPD
jgi:uncharacterized membrane protein YgdD (TMEM256/DUF423 family)